MSMIKRDERNMLAAIDDLLIKTGMIKGGGQVPPRDLTIESLAGDGSSRKFWRISQGKKHLCLAVAPPSLGEKDLAEARAARAIGLHLLQNGVRVPEQYGWDAEHGILLFEDLGDCKLHDYVLKKQGRKEEDFIAALRLWYQQVIEGLVVMQVRGAISFDTKWCWDSPRYDRTLMLERESGYFLRAFWQDLLGNKEPAGLQEEFIELADRAARIPSIYFLHRDFQSRNIMIHEKEVCFIDFQGGRQGPLGYDLASLLIDPYAALPDDFQEELQQLYLDKLEELIVVDRQGFREEYLLLALQRNLQIVGAFSFLSQQRNKPFFQQFLRPALISLEKLLRNEIFVMFPVLKKTVDSALTSLK
ncbi:MAG: phosphotransferase [Proteobacteria bacterium]|nr:phosphotransferase [Pseudomonadota bacterium]